VCQQPSCLPACLPATLRQAPTLPQLLVRPIALAIYFEQRKPVDVWSFIKSPYGLMIGFMVFGIVVFPMLKVGGCWCYCRRRPLTSRGRSSQPPPAKRTPGQQSNRRPGTWQSSVVPVAMPERGIAVARQAR